MTCQDTTTGLAGGWHEGGWHGGYGAIGTQDITVGVAGAGLLQQT